jgi:Mycothiol maleylpyruvate isomerase N-terminal domain
MQPDELEKAYVPLVRELRDGDFDRPETGWGADHVAAHVALNNDYFTSAVREVLATGAASYDNETAVDYDQLTAYASKFAVLGDLADDVARSATELAAAFGDLQAEDPEAVVPTVIRHDGRIVRDGPGLLVELIEGNATYHLAMHYDQLLALRPAR